MTEIKTEAEGVDLRAIVTKHVVVGGYPNTMGIAREAFDLGRSLSLQDELVKALTQIVQCDDGAETKHLVLADCTDNDGKAYQSQALSNHLCRARSLLTRIKSESGGSHD